MHFVASKEFFTTQKDKKHSRYKLMENIIFTQETWDLFQDKFGFDPRHTKAIVHKFRSFISFDTFETFETTEEKFWSVISSLDLAGEIVQSFEPILKENLLSKTQIEEIRIVFSRYLFISFIVKLIRRVVRPWFRPVLFMKNFHNGRGPISQILKYFSPDMEPWIERLQYHLKRFIYDPFIDELITPKKGARKNVIEDELLLSLKAIIISNSKQYMPTVEKVVEHIKSHYPLIFPDLPNSDPNSLRQAMLRAENSNLKNLLLHTETYIRNTKLKP